jgi:hypothetical protein
VYTHHSPTTTKIRQKQTCKQKNNKKMPYVVIKEEAVSHHNTMTFDHLQVCIGEKKSVVGFPPKSISSEFRSQFLSKLILTFHEIIQSNWNFYFDWQILNS